MEVDWDQDTLSFVYDGQQHVPSATVRDGFLIGDDEAEVIVSGAQTDPQYLLRWYSIRLRCPW